MANVTALLVLLLKVVSNLSNDTTITTAVDEAVLNVVEAKSQWPKIRVINDLETLWEVPPDPKGVLFVAHGCNHQGSDFWPSSSRCLHCLGLPEELIVRSTALQRGYALVAVTSYNRTNKCWHNTAASRSEDLQRVPGILRSVVQEEGLGALPLLVFGASSGGGFVQRLVPLMPEIRGVVAEIVPVNTALYELDGGRRYPPVVYVHMAARDPGFAQSVAEALDYCREAGIPAAEIQVNPRPVTPDFLQRSPLISSQVAQEIVGALNSTGLLDKEGQLLSDPRQNGDAWRQAVQPVVGGLSLEADASHVSQLLNVAYAQHELVGDPLDTCLTWLEAGGSKSMEDLLPYGGF